MAVQQPVETVLIPQPHAASPAAFRTHKPLPHPQSQSQKRDIDAFVNGDQVQHSSHKPLKRSNGHSVPGSIPANALFSSDPPSPPRAMGYTLRSVSSPTTALELNGAHTAQLPSVGQYNGLADRISPALVASSPSAAALDLPTRPPLNAFSPSSRAESFRTAREEQWLSDEEVDGESMHQDISGAVKAPSQMDSRDGLGLDFERDYDSTPTPKKLQQATVLNAQNHTSLAQPDGHSAESIPDREWDTNLMRNVTVRRKPKPLALRPKLQEDEERVAAREIVPKLFSESSEEDGPEPLTPVNDHFAQTMPSAQRSEEKPKRYSGSSHTSTILEAIIIPSSPPRRRTLRHVSKNLSLRSDDGSSRPSSSSNHASIMSEDLSANQLHDRLRAEHINRANGIFTPDPSGPTPPIALKHHSESRSLRQASMSSESPKRRRASDGTSTSSPTSYRHRSISGTQRAVSGPVDQTTRFSFSDGSEQLQLRYDAPIKSTFQQAEPANNQLTRAATRRALQRMDSSGGTLDLNSRPISFPRDVPRSRHATISMVETRSQKDMMAHGLDSKTSKPDSLVREKRADSNATAQSEAVTAVESIPRVSFDQSTVTTGELHRGSTISNLRPDSEHANARHIFAQHTPYSQISEHEIGEANAINIYPHNNDSLLVVQQVARPSGVLKQGSDDDTRVPGWPTLTVQPATPPQQFSSVNVDSPLKNPRQPPLPPIINIHPATPASELDGSPLDAVEAVVASDKPTRSMSLKERAARYSGNMMRPIITRTTSLRRSYYHRSRPPRRGAPRHSLHDQKSENSGLHPFWQPRGFWDEYSDSDSESDWGEPDLAKTRRLPAGGDTTELGEPRGFAKVLNRTGFGRGFLIGNSLGLERAGTNRRKPTIQLPVGLGQRTSGRVVMQRNSHGSLQTIGTESLRSARIAKRSIESLRQLSQPKTKKAWDPRCWQVQYIGVGGMRDLWRHKQAEKRRRELKTKIGVRYSIENAPTSN